jgi:hypothetical protein
MLYYPTRTLVLYFEIIKQPLNSKTKVGQGFFFQKIYYIRDYIVFLLAFFKTFKWSLEHADMNEQFSWKKLSILINLTHFNNQKFFILRVY